MTLLGAVAGAASVAAALLAGLRWLRVAQREHYLAGSVTRFAWRWWSLPPFNVPLALVAIVAAVASGLYPAAALATAAAVAGGPIGLGLRGRTSKLVWTRRLKTLAGTYIALLAGALAVGLIAGAGPLAAAAAAAGTPLVIDAALAISAPLESSLARRYRARASERLARTRPRIVAVTGSYGKTSTKGYVAHLVGASHSVVASPASYNNRAGLARTVNEHLVPGTEVLVAEMGAYGPGEIAALCRFMPPEIAVITAIGPMHLERFGTLERTLEAKAEITVGARAVVLAIDDERLAGLAARLQAAGRRVIGCSGVDRAADVAVVPEQDAQSRSVLACYVAGELVGCAGVDGTHRPAATSNVACAVAVALELDVPEAAIVGLLASLPTPPNRLQVYRAPGGFTVVDDTFNSNPAGTKMALQLLSASAGAGAHRVVVTPGMVELGPVQAKENATFTRLSAEVATDLVLIGRTNRRALLSGLSSEDTTGPPPLTPVVVGQFAEAVAWVRAHLGPGDAVLYENDLPDHFP